MRNKVVALVIGLLFATTLVGCSGAVHGGQAPSEEPSKEAPGTSSAAPPNTEMAVSLVPIQSTRLPFQLQIPEGWVFDATEVMDVVTIGMPESDYPKIVVTTRKLGTVQPRSETEELDTLLKLSLTNPRVKKVQWQGAQTAHEVYYEDNRGKQQLTVIGLWMYGSTHYTFVNFESTTAEFPQWEPIFRRSMQTFVPLKLDAETLPGRP